MDRNETALAVLQNGELAHQTQPSRPVPWWSFTKTVLAAAALRLVDQGQVTLDDQLPEQRFSLRQLLRHTSGVRSYTDLDAYLTMVKNADPPWPAEEMLERVRVERPAFEPGTLWAYSNTGYHFVRTIIETTTGDPIQTALDRLIFAPLGIEGVIVGQTPADLDRSQWGNATRYDPRYVYHGLLIGPAIAAARTLHGILEGGILPSQLLDQMQKPIPLGHELPGRPGREFGYGIGLMIALEGPAGRSFGHTGHDWTSVDAVYHFPDLTPARTVAVFLPGDRHNEVEWAAVNAALSPDGRLSENP
jgi:D-alanyl-D-alanine carboxypeptidase